MFAELETPSVKTPKDPEETVNFDKAGKFTSTITRFEEITYNERIQK